MENYKIENKKHVNEKEINEILKLLKGKKYFDWRLYIRFAFHTGVRICEYAGTNKKPGLEWNDLNLDKGTGFIRRECTKTNAGERPIYINDQKLLNLLKIQKAKSKTNLISKIRTRQWSNHMRDLNALFNQGKS